MSAELVERLRANLRELPELVATLPPDRLFESPGEGEWSARQVLAHMADFEPIFTARLRMILTLDRPQLPHYDQAAYTARFGDGEEVADALERFAVNRRANIRVLERLEPADWERPGLHPERGEEPLRRTVEMLDRHDRLHLEQMREAVRL